MLLCVQVRAYPTHLGEVRSNWVDVLWWRREAARQRLKSAIPGFKVRWWRQKVTFREGGGLSITPRWHIKHKHAIYRVVIGLLLMVITWQLFGTPIGVVGAVIDSTAGGAWNVGATWVGGVPPATGDDARIMGTHAVQLQQAEVCGSCEIQADGTLDLNTWNLTCDSTNGAGFAFDNDGTLQNNAGMITFEDDGANAKVDFVGALGDPNDITVDYHDWDVIQDTPVIMEGNLVITTGDWSTGAANHACTVVGGAILNGGGFDGNASGVVHGWIDINSGTYIATAGNTTISSEDAGSTYAFDNDGIYTHSGGSLTFTFGGVTKADFAGGGAGNPFTVIVNHANLVLTLDSNSTFDNDLTITAGELDTSGTNYALTVTKDVSVTGTATGNASAISFGSLTVNASGTYSATSGVTTITSETVGGSCVLVNAAGTYTHNNGTMTVTIGEATFFAVPTAAGALYNLIINNAAADIRWNTSGTIANDLTITAGLLRGQGGNETLTVTGDVDVTGTLGAGIWTVGLSFGSLTINSGGEYDATSGTTTITNRSGGSYAILVDAAGTFTHNNGTVTNASTVGEANFLDMGGDSLYNFIVNHNNNQTRLRTNNLTIANDLTITLGTLSTWDLTTARAVTVTGDVNITGTMLGITEAMSFASLTINSGGEYSATTGTTTITNESTSRFVWVKSGGTFTHNNGRVKATISGSDTFFDMAGTGNFYDLECAVGAPRDLRPNQNATIENNVYVTSGTFDFTVHNYTLTLIGDLVMDTSAAAVGTGTGAWAIGGDVTVDVGDFICTSGGDVTVTGDVDVTDTITGNDAAISLGSLTIQAAGTYDATSGTTTLTSRSAVTSGGFVAVAGATLTHNNGTIAFDSDISTTWLDWHAATGNPYNVTFDSNKIYRFRDSSSAHSVDNDVTVIWGDLRLGFSSYAGQSMAVSGDLTVTLGTFSVGETNDATLTVTGDADVTGTLAGSAGAISLGSLTIASGGTYDATSGVTTITAETAGGYALLNDAAGVYTHNNGTITFTYASTTLVDLGGDSAYNFIVNHATIVVTLDGNGLDVANDLTVTAGEMDCLALGLSVTGDVDLSDVLDGNTSAVSMGSLTINNGGLYDATDGTTSITSETAGGDSVYTASGGTYTHNSGLLEIVPSTDTRLRFEGTGNPYDLEYNAPGQTVTIFGANLTADNDFTITDGEFDTSTLDLTVTGATSITGTLTGNSSTVVLATTTINGGGTLTAPDGSGSLSIDGSFNTDGTFTHSDGTVTFNPTGASLVQGSGVGALTFYNLILNGNSSDRILGIRQDITVENTITVTTGHFRPNPTLGTVTVTVGTNASVGNIVNNDIVDFAINTTNAATIAAASSAYPIMFTGNDMDWDGGGALSLVTLQDCTYIPNATIGTATVTVTATRVDFRGTLTVTTATLKGTMCVIDVTNLTVSSGLYVEGWFDLTDNTRGGYDWILVAGDYTLSSNTTYTSRVNFYKPGGATLTLDTGTSLTVTDATVDGTFITAEADLLDTNNGTFTVKYTMDMKIVDAIGVAIQSVVLTAYDQFDVQLWTQTTDSNGDITAQATIAAIYGVGGRVNNLINLTIVLSGYQTMNYNFTLDRPMDYTLGLPAASTASAGIGGVWYKDAITIYQVTGKGDYAERAYDAGTVVSCRVNNLEVELTAPDGSLFTSTNKIVCPAGTAVDVDDKVLLPDTTIAYVKQVQNVKNAPGAAVMVVIFT